MEIRNYSKYSNAKVDELLDTARITLDENERDAIYQELLIKLSDDVPSIPTIWNTKNIAANKDLKGVASNPWSFYNLYEFSWS